MRMYTAWLVSMAVKVTPKHMLHATLSDLFAIKTCCCWFWVTTLHDKVHQLSQQSSTGKSHSCSPLKRLKPSAHAEAAQADGLDPSAAPHVDSDDAELARKLHEQLNGLDSPTAAPITRHITRVRKAPTFYKPEV